MLLRKIVSMTVAALIAVSPAAALAQTMPAPRESSAALVAPPPSARALALAHRYMEVMHVEELNKKMMVSMFSGMRGNFAKTTGLSDAKGDDALASFQAILAPMVEKLIGRMEPIVAETFTEQELQALVDFYGSPVGQSALQKIPTMTAKMSAISIEMMRETTAQAASACKGEGCPPKP